jgi:sporulation protein YlmC with PRC-barrel domain
MRKLLLAGVATAALALAGSTVWAQSNNNSDHQNLRAELTQMLQKSGYTDIKVAPSSFMAHAKDRDGNRVVMSISPDEFTEVATNVGDNASDRTTGKANNSDSADRATGSTYVNVPDRDDLSSTLVGLNVYNIDNKDIGTIKDIAMNPNGRASAYILSVGGFLGMGDHYIAVNPAAVKVTYSDSDKKWHAKMNVTADQLKAAPEFKYTGRWSSNRT